jgi:hypothetical protein
MTDYEAVDLRFSSDGDLVLDPGGGIVDTSLYPLLSLKQEIITRILTNVGDWPQHPWMGTNMQQYIGEKNDDETMQALSTSLRQGLTNDDLVSDRDLTIEWSKWDAHTVLILVTINVGTLDPDGEGKLQIPFAFDFNDLGVMIYDQ